MSSNRISSGPLITSSLDTVSVALYTALEDGQWHDQEEVIGHTARVVAPMTGLREGQRKRRGRPTATGSEQARVIASGQRSLAKNRIMIQARNTRVEIGTEENTGKYRIHPDTLPTWLAHAKIRRGITGTSNTP